MSISLTISDVTNMSTDERSVLERILGLNNKGGWRELQRAVESVPVEPAVSVAPVEPTEVFSPHMQVVESAAPAAFTVTDKRGMAWDGRIHSSSKAMNQDGTWRNRRGVDSSLLTQVEAALRGTPAFVVPPAPPVAPAFVIPPAPPALPAPPAPPAPPTGLTFQQFMHQITPHLVSGKLQQSQLAECVARNGLDNLPRLITRPELMQPMLDELLGMAGVK